MTTKQKSQIIQILREKQGDDLPRAIHAFKGMTPEEMQKPFRMTAMTRQQVLDSYFQHEHWINELIIAVDEIKCEGAA